MFRGIVETTGTVASIEARGDDRSFIVDAPDVWSAELSVGDSVAVDGACFTVVSTTSTGFGIDAIATTVGRTLAGAYAVGSVVNLEKALRVGDRVDGHFVQGHVDGLGEVWSIEARDQTRLLEIRIPSEVHAISVPRGSITINGVSLTISRLLDDDRCEIGIIPHTWKETNLGALEVGDRVNVEGDLIGKHVGRMIAAYSGGS